MSVPAVKCEAVDEGVRGSYPDAKLVAEALEEGYIIVRKADSQNFKPILLSCKARENFRGRLRERIK